MFPIQTHSLLANGYNVTDIANAILEVEEAKRQRQETFHRMNKEGVSLIGNLTHWMIPQVFSRKEEDAPLPAKTTIPNLKHKSVSARSA
jgi:hypothetical protein